jgi:drug/metabolite transporter (DMT)-like permease
MQVARRSSEKHVANNVSSLGMAWIQQAVALPFIIFSLFFAKFYWPSELSSSFWTVMAISVVFFAVDIFCYFKALSLADVSYVAPLMALTAIGNIVGAYFVLGQVPSIFGFAGAVLIVSGAAITYSVKRRDEVNKLANRAALLLVLLIVVVRSFNANLEVLMLRESNPTTFNFYSSLLTVPLILLVTAILMATNRTGKYKGYWKKLGSSASKHQWLLLFIGFTYTINMLATYQAKLIGPNAGYVGAIKAASVLPMMLVGLLFFKEKIVGKQWVGLVLILFGLVLLALN